MQNIYLKCAKLNLMLWDKYTQECIHGQKSSDKILVDIINILSSFTHEDIVIYIDVQTEYVKRLRNKDSLYSSSTIQLMFAEINRNFIDKALGESK